MDLSSKYFLQISAIFFQSCGPMSSDSFMKGDSIIGLHIFSNSGAIFSISFASVGMAPPVFGSRRDEIVPPVIMIATFGRFLLLCNVFILWSLFFDFSRIFAPKISASRIPIL